jgi:uncharacterized protein
MDIIRKQAKWAELKMPDGEEGSPGTGEGWGAVYGNEDRDEEILAPGVFADSLETCLRDGFLGVGHDWHCGMGTFTALREDTNGLYIAWEWHGDPEAQMYRQRVKERLTRGKSVGLSVGFRVKEWKADEEETNRWGSPKRTITRAELFEVSVVTVPSNREARVTDAKGGRKVLPVTVREFEEFLREEGFSRSQAEAIASKGFRVLETGQQGEPAPGNDESPPADFSAELQRYFAREARLAGIIA